MTTKYKQNQKYTINSDTRMKGRIAWVTPTNEYVILTFPTYENDICISPGQSITVTEEWLDSNVTFIS